MFYANFNLCTCLNISNIQPKSIQGNSLPREYGLLAKRCILEFITSQRKCSESSCSHGTKAVIQTHNP